MSTTDQSTRSNISTSASRWAVIIGIDHYGNRNNLQGCANDAILVSEYMLKYLNVPQENIFLHIAQNKDWDGEDSHLDATPEAVKNSLQQVMNKAKSSEDSFVHIHFSGHGDTRETVFRKGPVFDKRREGLLWYPGLELTETSLQAEGNDGFKATEKGKDAKDELLCFPQDQYITDVEFGKMLTEMTVKGLTVSVTLDCCFAGGATRGNEAIRYKSQGSQKTDHRGNQSNEDTSSQSEFRKCVANDSLLYSKQEHYNAIMACQPHQYAGEGVIPERHSYKRFGYFTSALINGLESLGARREHITYRQFQGIIGVVVRDTYGEKQIPAHYGPDNRILFDNQTGNDSRELAYVMKDMAHKLVIDRGQVMGARAGDKYRLLERVLRTSGIDEGIPVRLTTVRHFQSEFAFENKSDVPKDVSEFLQSYRVAQLVEQAPIHVRVTADSSEKAKETRDQLLEKSLTPFFLFRSEEDSITMRRTEAGGYENSYTRWWNARMYALGFFSSIWMYILCLFWTKSPPGALRATQRTGYIHVHVGLESLEIRDDTGRPIDRLPKIPVTDDKMTERLMLGLKTMYNFQQLLHMETPKVFQKQEPFTVDISLSKDPSDYEDPEETMGELVAVYRFKFTNTTKTPLYITLLNLDPFHGISIIHPDEGMKSQYVLGEETTTIYAHVPPEMGDQYHRDNIIHDAIRLIVTTQPVPDVGYFEQPELKSFEQSELESSDPMDRGGQNGDDELNKRHARARHYSGMPTTGWWVVNCLDSCRITPLGGRVEVKKKPSEFIVGNRVFAWISGRWMGPYEVSLVDGGVYNLCYIGRTDPVLKSHGDVRFSAQELRKC
ncbi:caspase domain-containing protein [Xylaria scruposa]|nr:caspase domain-containing protein [Xylaria scruposa]